MLCCGDIDVKPWAQAAASAMMAGKPNAWRPWPDTAVDQRLYEAMSNGRHEAWLATPLADIEQAGQQELLNWYTGLGAVDELGLRLQWSRFVETHCFNSNKVFAVWR